jgi:YD repeat-containing protein
MRPHHLFAPIFAAALLACGSDNGTTAPDSSVPAVLLREIEIPNLPAPYYHFEYDAQGRVNLASFASGLTRYEVLYNAGRIKELANTTLGSGVKLAYSYDAAGRVDTVRYLDASGAPFTIVSLSYNGARLMSLERRRKLETTFVLEKTMSFSYYPDGNIEQIVDHRPAVAGQQADATTTDRFEQYDDKINVDGFSLLHNDFFDHLVLLPGVVLQRGNPKKETFVADEMSYTVEYTYVYDDARRPQTKSGSVAFTTGPLIGQTFQTLSRFTYY